MIVNLISSFGHNAIKSVRALGRAGFMLFGALIGKPQVRKTYPFINQTIVCFRCAIVADYFIVRLIYWNGPRVTRLCDIGGFCR